MKIALEVFQGLVQYISNNMPAFTASAKVTTNTIKEAHMIKDKIVNLSGNRYYYNRANGVICTMDTQTKTCNCNKFLDKAICKHLVAVCLIDGVELHGMSTKAKSLRTRRRRNKLTVDDNDSLNESIIPGSPKHDQVEVGAEATQTQSITQIQARKPGRPKKIPSALVVDDIIPSCTQARKPGRPKNIPPALVVDDIIQSNTQARKPGRPRKEVH